MSSIVSLDITNVVVSKPWVFLIAAYTVYAAADAAVVSRNDKCTFLASGVVIFIPDPAIL